MQTLGTNYEHPRCCGKVISNVLTYFTYNEIWLSYVLYFYFSSTLIMKYNFIITCRSGIWLYLQVRFVVCTAGAAGLFERVTVTSVHKGGSRKAESIDDIGTIRKNQQIKNVCGL